MKKISIALFCLTFFACETEDDGDAVVISDVTATVNTQVSTILNVHWTLSTETDNIWLRFTFENGEYFETPKKPGVVGDNSEVILGVPSETEVTFHVVYDIGGGEVESEPYLGTTGALPGEMPMPTLVEYNPSLASADKWLLGSVENAKSPTTYYSSEFWMYILDRQARIVWYYKDPLDSRILFPKVSADGTHIIYDVTGYMAGERFSQIHRSTLDFEYDEEIEINDMNWAYSEKADGTIIYNMVDWENIGANLLILKERLPDGSVREIWDCEPWAESIGVNKECYSNTVNSNPNRDSVILSMPYLNTILEIDRETGTVLSQWGDAPGSWAFSPADAGLEFNHFPTITKDGTLLVSSHLPGGNEPGEHRVMEFEIDSQNETLNEIWTWGEGVEVWPAFSGEAVRMENGNTLLNTGSGGGIYEVTPDKQTAWHVLWDADFPDAEDNLLCGHSVLVNDLYELNRGLQE